VIGAVSLTAGVVSALALAAPATDMSSDGATEPSLEASEPNDEVGAAETTSSESDSAREPESDDAESRSGPLEPLEPPTPPVVMQLPPPVRSGPTHAVDRTGEWYTPTARDERFSASVRKPWRGLYHAAEFRTVVHAFFWGPVRGGGTEILGRVDFAETVGLQIGGFFPRNAIDIGFNFFGNLRYELVRWPRYDLSFGVVLPELTFRTLVLTQPFTEVVLGAGVQVAGLRLVYADLIHVTVRGGAPSVWFSVPELGVAMSATVSFDAGIQF
jgi:hypothetical protein